MLESYDLNDVEQLKALNYNKKDLKSSLEKIIRNKDYHSDEISETDEERVDNDRRKEGKIKDKNGNDCVIKVYEKAWRSEQVIE
jgi:hypothetical protein